MFPDVFDDEPRVGEEAADSILRSRSDVSASVTAWLTTDGVEENLICILEKENDPKFSLSFTSQDFGALLDTCIDAYLVSNPEVSDGWKDVLAGLGKGPKESYPDYVKVVERTPTIPERRRLSNMFDKYANATEIGESARLDFGLGVRRFIQLHGDIDVQQVDRRHVEDFRDLLRKMPSRPPNDIRKLPMTDQVFLGRG